MSTGGISTKMVDYLKLKRLVKNRFDRAIAAAEKRRDRDLEAIRIVKGLYLELDMVNRALKMLTGKDKAKEKGV
jgi:hypothetical protein